MISFIGLGKLGLTCAETFAEHYTVTGYDIVTRTSEKVKVCDTVQETIEGARFIFIAVQTPHDSQYDGSNPTTSLPVKNFKYDYVIEALQAIKPYVKSDQIVCLISTCLPGTVRNVLLPHIEGMRFIYNPYLIAMGTIRWDMIKPEMVIMGGEDEAAMDSLEQIYKTVARSPRIVRGTWEEAESIKIFYNTFITAKLTLVNMIQDVAEKLGHMNVDVVTHALAHSNMRIMSPKYMIAGMGDGGPCHPRDNIALSWLANKLDMNYDLFSGIMQAREGQAKNMAIKLHSYRLPIVILGKTYKPKVPYTEGSPSMLVGYYVEKLGREVYYYDQYFEKPPKNILENPAVYLIAHSSYATYNVQDDNDFDHSIIAPGSIVVDPWRKCPDIPGVKVIHYGNTR